MGLWEALTGRSGAKPGQPRRAVPRAERGDHAADGGRLHADRPRLGLLPRGRGRRLPPDAGRRRRAARRRRRRPDVELTVDEFGFTWLVAHRSPGDMSALCTDLHTVNTTLEAQGFGPGLLCSLVPFADPAGGAWAWSTSTSRGRSSRSRRTGRQPRQPARAPGPRPPGRRAADGARPGPLDGAVGRSGPLTEPPCAARRACLRLRPHVTTVQGADQQEWPRSSATRSWRTRPAPRPPGPGRGWPREVARRTDGDDQPDHRRRAAPGRRRRLRRRGLPAGGLHVHRGAARRAPGRTYPTRASTSASGPTRS